MKIKNKLQDLISDGSTDEAIRILKNFIVKREYLSEILVQSARFKNINKDKVKGIIEEPHYQIQSNQINSFLVDLILELPHELTLLKEFVINLIKEQRILSSAIEILDIVCRNEYSDRVQNFNKRFIASQDFESRADLQILDSDQIDKLYTSNATLEEEILEFVNEINENYLFENWEEKLWSHLKFEKSEYLPASQNNDYQDETSRFYDDIIDPNRKIDPKIRGKLLLWQEEYLTKNYLKAKNICDEIRIDDGISSSQIYEYLLLSHYKLIGAEKLIKEIVSSRESTDFKKLLFYVERVKDLDFKTKTKNQSLEEVYINLLNSIHRLYQNISHDYLIDIAKKGRSSKRNLIKACIEIVIDIHQRFKINLEKENIHPIFGEFLLELEGGGRYDWIKIENKDLVDVTSFEAKKYRSKILDITNPDNSPQKKSELGEHLYYRLKQKGASIQKLGIKDSRVNDKFLRACHLGSIIYEQEDFRLLAYLFNEGVPLLEKIYDESSKIKSKGRKSSDSLDEFLQSLEEYEPLGIKTDNENLSRYTSESISSLSDLERSAFLEPFSSFNSAHLEDKEANKKGIEEPLLLQLSKQEEIFKTIDEREVKEEDDSTQSDVPQTFNEHPILPNLSNDDRKLEEIPQNDIQKTLDFKNENQKLSVPISLLRNGEQEESITAQIDHNGTYPEPLFPLKKESTPTSIDKKLNVNAIPLDPPRSPGLFKPLTYSKSSKDVLSKGNRLDTSAKTLIILTIVVVILIFLPGITILLPYNLELGLLFILFSILLIVCAWVIREFLI